MYILRSRPPGGVVTFALGHKIPRCHVFPPLTLRGGGLSSCFQKQKYLQYISTQPYKFPFTTAVDALAMCLY